VVGVRSRALIAGFAVVLAIVFAPVGSASAAPTRAEYIAQADPICQATMDAERRAIGSGFLAPLRHGRLKVAGRKLRREFAAFAPGVEQLAALEPPAADAQLIASWVQDLRAQVPLGNRVANTLIKGRFPAKLLARLGKLNQTTQGLVAGFGFQSCQDL
jgi:hypothetical protein